MNTKTILVAICMIMLGVLIGCKDISAVLRPKKIPSDQQEQSTDEPLVSSWKMSRVSIEPSMPKAIPGLIVDQIIPRNPTWSISMSGSQVTPRYDARTTWFNPLGFTAEVKTPAVTESADRKSVTLSGGGTIQSAKLPVLLALLGAASDISIDYTDQIVVTMTEQDKIAATISYSARGRYTGAKGEDSFNNAATVKYTGTRK